MNKVELIEALAPRLGGRQLAAMAVEALVDAILREVATGGTVGITGFGTFEKVDRAPRTGRNPHTGAPVPIAATSSPRFRPGAYFKEVVADPDRLPAEGLAGVRVGSHGEMAEPEQASRPSSVRRSTGHARPGGSDGGRPEGTDGEGAAPAASAPSSGARRRRAASGTPPTVRAQRKSATVPGAGIDLADGDAPGADAPGPPAGGRGHGGGQDITMGMITAKKAQLARVKNDDVVAHEGGPRKKDSGKEKDAKGRRKDKGKDAAAGKDKAKKGKKAKKRSKSS